MNQWWRRGIKALAILWLVGSFASSTAGAYPLNPWGAAVPAKTLTLNPFLYVYSGPSFYPIVYAGYGLSDKADIWAGATLNIEDGSASAGTVELFPRYFLTPELALAAHFYINPGESLIPAPELHFNKGWDNFALTVNAGYRPEFVPKGVGFRKGSINLIAAPEYYFTEKVSLFLEIDPTLYFVPQDNGTNETRTDLGVTLVPGIWFALDDDILHSFALAVQVPLPFERDEVSFGIWYCTAFGGE